MRLLIVSLNADPLLGFGTLHSGGQTKYVLELGKNLVGLGWTIDVVTVRNQGLPSIGKVTEDFLVHRVSRRDGRDYGYDIELKEITELARNHPPALPLSRYSVVLSCYWLSGVYVTQLESRHQVPRVLTLCSLGYFKQTADPSEAIRQRIEVETQLVRDFDCIIATNRCERDVLRDVYGADPSKIRTIPRGVDIELFGTFREIPFCR
jgi:D-inositol-3-phosphate glycosyltransferase